MINRKETFNSKIRSGIAVHSDKTSIIPLLTETRAPWVAESKPKYHRRKEVNLAEMTVILISIPNNFTKISTKGNMAVITKYYRNCLIPWNPDANKAKPTEVINGRKYQKIEISWTEKFALR